MPHANRFAVFIDAGYFFAAGAYALTAGYAPGRQIKLTSPADTVRDLSDRISLISGAGAQLLRFYWYDAMESTGSISIGCGRGACALAASAINNRRSLKRASPHPER